MSKNNFDIKNSFEMTKLSDVLANVKNKISPLWSLENYVAVNPFWGFKQSHFKTTSAYFNKINSQKLTMDKEFYLDEIKKGVITNEDLKSILKSYPKYSNIDTFIEHIKNSNESNEKIKLIHEIISNKTNTDWTKFIINRISNWAASYYDKSPTIWRSSNPKDFPFDTWKIEANNDYSPIIMGIKNYKETLSLLHELNALETISFIKKEFNLNDEAFENYTHALCLRVNGWSSYMRGVDWDNDLYGIQSNQLNDLIAILLTWDYLIFKSFKDQIIWESIDLNSDFSNINIEEINDSVEINVILQNAFDKANQRILINQLNTSKKSDHSTPCKADFQAVFCIDVRSEIYRRNLELQSDKIKTHGYAGFFGLALKYEPISHFESQNLCPVLLPAAKTVKEKSKTENLFIQSQARRKDILHLNKVWKSFKSGAISCFSFVSPVGLAFLFKILADALHITRPTWRPEKRGLTRKQFQNLRLEHNFTIQEQIDVAFGNLKNMGITENFGEIILITGHGSNTTNNPHATGLDCGACGGHSGEVNSKILASILNNKEVREALVNKGISIPDTTVFIAALHDTTTDEITLYPEEQIKYSKREKISELKTYLDRASLSSRIERLERMEHTSKNLNEKNIFLRSKDWSQTRPELGLAGCNAFVVAPREVTKNSNLGGKSFLHDYNWEKDQDFKTLELIITAPMVVTSWINLQYYASTVDPDKAGAGNKVLHNVVGGFGVLEGFSGDLKVGLPKQSIHDGIEYQHLPQRLNVMIAAPLSAINNILEKHEHIKQLVENEWIFLFAIDETGKVKYKYDNNLEWEIV